MGGEVYSQRNDVIDKMHEVKKKIYTNHCITRGGEEVEAQSGMTTTTTTKHGKHLQKLDNSFSFLLFINKVFI